METPKMSQSRVALEISQCKEILDCLNLTPPKEGFIRKPVKTLKYIDEAPKSAGMALSKSPKILDIDSSDSDAPLEVVVKPKPRNVKVMKLSECKTSEDLVDKMKFTSEELKRASSYDKERKHPPKHYGGQRKSPFLNNYPRYKVKQSYMKSPRLTDFAHDVKDFKFAFNDLTHAARRGHGIHMEHAIELYESIDFEGGTEPHGVENAFGSQIAHVDFTLAPKLHHSVGMLPNFEKHYIATFKGAETAWQLYMAIHTTENDHHTDFWRANRPGDKMTPEATLHLLCDHFVSALRNHDNCKDAFRASMSWLYSVVDGAYVINPKFSILDAPTVVIFLQTIRRVGLFNPKNARKMGYIKRQSECMRSREWDIKYLKEMNKVFSNPKDDKVARTVSTRQMNDPNSPFKPMLVEIQIHIAAVQRLMRIFGGIPVLHDHDKVNSFMVMALCKQFLKWSKDSPSNITPKHELHTETNRTRPALHGTIDMQDPHMTDTMQFAGVRAMFRTAKEIVQAIICGDTQYLTPNYSFVGDILDSMAWRDMIENDYFPSYLYRIMCKNFDQVPMSFPPGVEVIPFLELQVDSIKIPTFLLTGCSERKITPWRALSHYENMLYGHLRKLRIDRARGVPNAHVIRFYEGVQRLYFDDQSLHIETFKMFFMAYPHEFPVFSSYLHAETVARLPGPDFEEYPVVDMCDTYTAFLDHPEWIELKRVVGQEFVEVSRKITEEEMSDEEADVLNRRHSRLNDILELLKENFYPRFHLKMLGLADDTTLGGIEKYSDQAIQSTFQGAKSMMSTITSKITGLNINDMNNVVAQIRDSIPVYNEHLRENATQLGLTLDATTKTTKSIDRLVSTIDVNNMMNSMSKITSDITGLTAIVKEVFSKINVFIPDFVKPFGITNPIRSVCDLKFADLTAIVILYYFWKHTTGDLKHLYMIAMLYKLGVFKLIWQGVTYVMGLFADGKCKDSLDDDVHEETSFDHNETFGFMDPIRWFTDYIIQHKTLAITLIAMTIIAGLVGHHRIKSMSSPQAFNKEFVAGMKDIHSIGSGFRGLGTIFTYIMTGTTVALTAINKCIFGKEFKTIEEIRYTEVSNWMIECSFYSTNIGLTSLASSPQHLDKARKLLPTGNQLVKYCMDNTLPKHLMPFISQSLVQARKIYNACTAVSIRGTTRRTPIVVQFSGSSGLGKSVLQSDLVSKLYKKFYPSISEPSAFPIKSNQGKEDWDGYFSEHKICIIDDVNAIDDPEQVALFIVLVSGAPLVLPKAALEEKGTYFGSDFIICSTNTPAPTLTGVNYREAYLGRFHVTVEVKPNKAFSKCFDDTGRFDKSLFTKYYPNEDCSLFPHLVFNMVSYATGVRKEIVTVDGSPTQNLNYEAYVRFIENETKRRWDNDPHQRNDKDQLAAQRAEFNQTINEMITEYEETGHYSMMLSAVRSNFDYDAKSLSVNPAFVDLPIEYNCMLEEDHDETAYMDVVALKKFKAKTPPIALDRACEEGEFIFKLDANLLNTIDSIFGGDSSLIAPSERLVFNPDYPHIAMPHKLYKHFKCWSEYIRSKRFQMLVRDEDLAKLQIFVHIDDPKDYLLLVDPQFRSALYRFVNAPMRERIDFMKNEIIPYCKGRKVRCSYIECWRKAKSTVHDRLIGFKESCRAFTNWLIDHWKLNLALLAASVVTIFLLTRLGRVLCGPHVETAAYNTAHPSSPLTRIVKNTQQTDYCINDEISDPLVQQFMMSNDAVPEHVAQEADLIGRNTVMFIDPVAGTNFQGVFIEGQVSAINYHSVYEFLNSGQPTLHLEMYRFPNYDTPIPVVLQRQNIRRVREQDLCLVLIKEISSFPSIKKKLLSRSDRDPAAYEPTAHYFTTPNNKILKCELSNVYEAASFKTITTKKGHTFKEHGSVVLKKHSMGGTSGGPIVSLSNNRARKLIGIQSTTKGGYSYISALKIEDFNELTCDFTSIQHEGPFDVDETRYEPFAAQDLGPDVAVLGSVSKQYTVGLQPKTMYKKTPIADLPGIQSNKEPAILNSSDPRAGGVDPLAKAISKQWEVNLSYNRLPEKYVIRAISSISHHINSRTRHYPKSKMGLRDAIRGRDGVPGYVPISLKTSPGIPLVLVKETLPGKHSWIRYDPDGGDITYLSPVLVQEVNYIDSKLKEGIITANSLYAFPKDETLPIEKIKQVKTRAVICGNLPFTIIYRMYNSDFEAAFHRISCTGLSPMTPGINVDSPSWQIMASCLLSKNSRGFDFDVSAFDKRFSPQLMFAVTSIINKFYNDGNDLQRECIAHNAIFGFIQYKDAILQPYRGMPSGFAGTTSYNTIGHLIMKFVFYCIACERAGFTHLANWSCFCIFVCVYIYGDDITFTVSSEILPWYNGKIVAMLYREFGWDVTMASGKETIDIDSPLMISGKPFDQLQFLQRNFRTDSEIPFITAALNKDSIKDLAYWIRKHETPRELLYENLQTSLFYIASHGRLAYDNWLKTVNSALDRIHYKTLSWSFDEVLSILAMRFYG